MMNDFNVYMRYEEWVCADLNEIVEQGDEANFSWKLGEFGYNEK